MKKTILSTLAVLALLAPQRMQAQVSDVSVIVSPTAGYTFWNKQLNVGNSAFYGARVGFGFGPILELRGNYERSFDLKGKLRKFKNHIRTFWWRSQAQSLEQCSLHSLCDWWCWCAQIPL